MDSTDIALEVGTVGLAATVVYAAFFNLLQSGIQIVGVGTALSLVLNVGRYVSVRQEGKRKKVQDGVQRLQPKIYDPLMAWAVAVKTTLDELGVDELYLVIPEPPDFTRDGDYVAIVGETLKTEYLKARRECAALRSLHMKVREEYKERVMSRVEPLGFVVAPGGIPPQLLVGLGSYGNVWDWSYNYNLGQVRKEAQHTRVQIYQSVAGEKRLVVVPGDEIWKAVFEPSTLASYSAYSKARKEFSDELGALASRLADAIRNGEKDWGV